jgi:uncharacterized membrane protein
MYSDLFTHPSSYNGMLKRIALFHFLANLTILFLLSHFEPVKAILGTISISIDIPYVKTKLGFLYILIPALFTVFFNVTKLHKVILEATNLRQNFDVNYILSPLAEETGSALNTEFTTKLHSNRNELMSKTFYKYTSSTKPQIDIHHIQTALGNWLWINFLLEFIPTCVLWGVTSYFISYLFMAVMGAVILISFSLIFFKYNSAKQSAQNQIQIILDEENWKNDIREQFSKI